MLLAPLAKSTSPAENCWSILRQFLALIIGSSFMALRLGKTYLSPPLVSKISHGSDSQITYKSWINKYFCTLKQQPTWPPLQSCSQSILFCFWHRTEHFFLRVAIAKFSHFIFCHWHVVRPVKESQSLIYWRRGFFFSISCPSLPFRVISFLFLFSLILNQCYCINQQTRGNASASGWWDTWRISPVSSRSLLPPLSLSQLIKTVFFKMRSLNQQHQLHWTGYLTEIVGLHPRLTEYVLGVEPSHLYIKHTLHVMLMPAQVWDSL